MAAPSQFVNNSSQALIIGGFGHASGATFRIAIAQNQSTILNLFPGDRVFVAWDSFLQTFHPNNPDAIHIVTVADNVRARYTITDAGWTPQLFPAGTTAFPAIAGVTSVASTGG